MIPCFNRDGMINVIGWFVGETIVGRFDRQYAECQAKIAADPNYKPDPFSDKPKGKTPKTTQDALDDIRARVAARKG